MCLIRAGKGGKTLYVQLCSKPTAVFKTRMLHEDGPVYRVDLSCGTVSRGFRFLEITAHGRGAIGGQLPY